MGKITWRVHPTPTGRFRCFERRGWPVATYSNDEMAAAIFSPTNEDYTGQARRGEHQPLRVRVAEWGFWNGPTYPLTFRWRTAVGVFNTLAEVKAHVRKLLEQHPAMRYPGQ